MTRRTDRALDAVVPDTLRHSLADRRQPAVGAEGLRPAQRSDRRQPSATLGGVDDARPPSSASRGMARCGRGTFARSMNCCPTGPSVGPVTLTRSAPRIANMDSTRRLDFQGNSVRDLSGNLIYDYLVRPGVSRAGSNPHLMQHIADGDPDTFWEPNLDDPPEDWWVEVDLGPAGAPRESSGCPSPRRRWGILFYRFILPPRARLKGTTRMRRPATWRPSFPLKE